MSERRLWALRDDDPRPCRGCGATLPYWTRTETPHGPDANHPIVVVDDLADIPFDNLRPVPLDDVPPEYRRETWNLSAHYREIAARHDQDEH